jgi:biopolymer transport protein ExbB/TolQ
MTKTKINIKAPPNSFSINDNPNILIVVSGLVINIGFLVIVLPFFQTRLGELIFQRGWTQFVTIYLACLVVAFMVFHIRKLRQEWLDFHRTTLYCPDLKDLESTEVTDFQSQLARNKGILQTRCERVLNAYREFQTRSLVTEFATDDAGYYQTLAQDAYVMPKALIWAIPLLGFIGTVIGIGDAVSNFSGLLAQSGEIDQIKDSIGLVTGGLGVAFDTTLLSLLLSVLLMLPLTYLEKSELNLLMQIEYWINENMLPKMPEMAIQGGLDEKQLQSMIREFLPDKLDLIEPVNQAIAEATETMVKEFLGQVKTVTQYNLQMLKQLNLAQEKHWQNNQELVLSLQKTIEKIDQNHGESSQILYDQSKELSENLNATINSLEQIDKTLRVINQETPIQSILEQVKDHFVKLKPALDQLSQPRRIVLMESTDHDQT